MEGGTDTVSLWLMGSVVKMSYRPQVGTTGNGLTRTGMVGRMAKSSDTDVPFVFVHGSRLWAPLSMLLAIRENFPATCSSPRYSSNHITEGR